ncbi:MAG: efflux RND transporter periplasmic adaptor subunit [Acidobacteria bacterium]|nr:efflux RND transporter periplasmic adaptor subunit [Acidobacteriota bacterium]
MTVEVATARRGQVMQQLVVVGNLVGDATVSVVPRAAGRLQDISVRLGDRVSRGQRIAKIEDVELQEQVKQQEAALEVSRATIRQREADLQLALTNAERSRNLFARQLLPKQTLDDTEARYQSAVAQLDLARAQNNQSTARLEELRFNLGNTVIVSPVNGFVARRAVDPGAFVGQNSPVVDVVDIGRVRLVANIIEKDLDQLRTGDETQVEVDAFPGEMFMGRVARVAPVLDPATRTASIEVEIPNPGFRLKPGMYARVTVTTDERKDALVVPSNAVVDMGGRRGVFLAVENDTVTFRPVSVGIDEDTQIEIVQGLAEGDRVVTTGAAALREGDRVVIAGAAGGRRGGGPTASGEAREGGSGMARAGTAATDGAAGAAPADGTRRGGGGRRGRGAPDAGASSTTQ